AAWGYSLLVQTPPKKPIIDVPTVAATPTAITVTSALSTPSIGPVSTSTIRIPTPSTGAATSSETSGTAVATTAVPPATSLKVTIKANGKSWVEAYADGDTTAK